MDYRILSLDGGGTWALIQVKALMHIYGNEERGHEVLRNFDFVVANSGGSIVLGALLEDMPLSEILKLFNQESTRKEIFSPTEFLRYRLLRPTHVVPKYSAEKKLPALAHVLKTKGNLKLADAVSGIRRPGSDSDLSILILSFDYDRNRARFFRSSPSGGESWGKGDAANVTLAEAIDGSTNAPVKYFDAPAEFWDGSQLGRYWDGAITGGNNPVLAGVTEAIARNVNPLDVIALSIGTASVALPWKQPDDPPSPYFQPISKSGLVTDLEKLALSILDDPPDVATFLAHVMTGGGAGLDQPADSRIVRMSPLMSPVKVDGIWKAPHPMSADEFKFLANIDLDAIEEEEVKAISNYADLWLRDVAPNQPIRMNGDTLKLELGQDRFSGALAAWSVLCSARSMGASTSSR